MFQTLIVVLALVAQIEDAPVKAPRPVQQIEANDLPTGDMDASTNWESVVNDGYGLKILTPKERKAIYKLLWERAWKKRLAIAANYWLPLLLLLAVFYLRSRRRNQWELLTNLAKRTQESADREMIHEIRGTLALRRAYMLLFIGLIVPGAMLIDHLAEKSMSHLYELSFYHLVGTVLLLVISSWIFFYTGTTIKEKLATLETSEPDTFKEDEN